MVMLMVRVMVVVLVSRDVLQTAVLTVLRGEYIVVGAWPCTTPCTTVTTAYSQFIDPPRLSGPGRSVLAVSQYSVLAQPAL